MTDDSDTFLEDAFARLIREALSTMGRDADAELLADRIRRLELGLPLEDEFIMILSWLGKCRLVHKLDQMQFPPASRSEYRVPDLLAVFEHNGRLTSVLIEVKGKVPFAFSWRPDYVEGLRRYGRLLQIPVLIACKWKQLGFWTLIDLDQYECPNKNYKYTLENSLKQNLMGLLAGDFMFVFQKGVGLHIKARKMERVSERQEDDRITEEWILKIEGAYFTNGLGQNIKFDVDKVAWPLICSSEAIEENTMTDTHLIHSLIVPEEHLSQLAHRSLVILLSLYTGDGNTLNWRDLLLEHKVPLESRELREAAIQGISLDYIQYVLDQVPQTKPVFLG